MNRELDNKMENEKLQETSKYVKKKKSNKSKSREKANHKHEYVNCLLKQTNNKSDGLLDVHKGTYCKVCGKIGNINFLETIETGEHSVRIMTNQEVLEKYKDLEVKEVNGIYEDKYVSI